MPSVRFIAKPSGKTSLGGGAANSFFVMSGSGALAGHGPVGRAAPGAAVLKPALPGAPAAAAAHHEHAHRWLGGGAVVRALEPAVEPAQAQRQKILGEIVVERCRRTEIDSAGM